MAVVWHLTKEFTAMEIRDLRKGVFDYLREYEIVAVASIELTCGKNGRPNNTVHFHFLTDDKRSIKEIRKLFNTACERQGLVRRSDFWISCQTLHDADKYFDYFTKRNCDDVILFSKGTGLQKFYQVGKWFKEGKGKIWAKIKAYWRGRNSNDSNGVDGKETQELIHAVCDPGVDNDWVINPVSEIQRQYLALPEDVLAEMDCYQLREYFDRMAALRLREISTLGVNHAEEP